MALSGLCRLLPTWRAALTPMAECTLGPRRAAAVPRLPGGAMQCRQPGAAPTPRPLVSPAFVGAQETGCQPDPFAGAHGQLCPEVVPQTPVPSGLPSSWSCAERRAPFLSKPGGWAAWPPAGGWAPLASAGPPGPSVLTVRVAEAAASFRAEPVLEPDTDGWAGGPGYRREWVSPLPQATGEAGHGPWACGAEF